MSFKALKNQFNLPVRFWIIALISFINSVSLTILIPILYPYAKAFGLNDFQASLLLTAYSVSQFIATPILGRLSDFLGRKPLLVISLIGTVVANLLACFTPFAWLFFTARILDGLTGGNYSIARAVISDTTRLVDRPKAFGLFDAAFRLGFVTGPAISYFAQQLPVFPGASSLGMSFFVAATISLVAVFLTVWLLPETLIHPKTAIQWNWQMFGFGKILKSTTRPKLGKLFILTFFSGFSFTIFTFALQPFFLNILQQDAKALASLFTLIGVIGLLTQLFGVDPLTRKFSLTDILWVALAARALIFWLIPSFPNLAMFVTLISFISISNAFPMPLLSTLLSINSEDREQGEVQGINASYLSISNAAGPMVSGLLVSISYTTPFWVTGGVMLITAGFALSLRPVLKT